MCNIILHLCLFTPPNVAIFLYTLTGRLWRCVRVRGCSCWSDWEAGRWPQRSLDLCARRRPRLTLGWTRVWRCEGSASTASLAVTPGSQWSGSNSDRWSPRGWGETESEHGRMKVMRKKKKEKEASWGFHEKNVYFSLHQLLKHHMLLTKCCFGSLCSHCVELRLTFRASKYVS